MWLCMELKDVCQLLEDLELERRGDFVLATRCPLQCINADIASELGIIRVSGKGLWVLDESHELVEMAVEAGNSFWSEADPDPQVADDPEELRWYLKQMAMAGGAGVVPKGIKPRYPVDSVLALAKLIRELEVNHGGICIISGAGMSTSAGILDFRSKGGFYDQLEPEKYGLNSAEDVYSIDQFRTDPMPFLRIERDYGGFYGGRFHPTLAHKFIAQLEQRKLLIRTFTQNVDGLESAAGVSDNVLVEAHGSYRFAECSQCRMSCDIEIVRSCIFDFEQPKVPHCPSCAKGVLKPACVFFGEKLPRRFWRERNNLKRCELLLVIGTSLQVEPFASLVDEVNPDCIRILINGETVGPFLESLIDVRSFVLSGDIDETIKSLCEALEWKV